MLTMISRRKKIKESNLIASNYHKLVMGDMKSSDEAKRNQFQNTEVQKSLEEKNLQLQNKLDDQFVLRQTLQKSSYQPIFHEPTSGYSIIKPAEDLIKEIAILELEVVQLEKHLLSMYRKTFDRSPLSLSKINGSSKPNSPNLKCSSSEHDGHHLKKSSMIDSISSRLPHVLIDNPTKTCSATPLDSSIYRSHSSLSQIAAYSHRTFPPRTSTCEAINSFHSLPLSMIEDTNNSNVSLADHLASSKFVDHLKESPNQLSEEMVKCISAIYCQLAEPSMYNHAFLSSPISFASSMSESPPLQGRYNRRSPQGPPQTENSSFNSWLNNPFRVEDSMELSESYTTKIEIHGICRDTWKLRSVDHMLQNFRSLVSQLEQIDPKKMKFEEKLAFWINIHNVLVMHAFLAYGIPQSNLKRTSVLLKAAYNIGGHTISVHMIQNSILKCQLPRPGQWLQSLLFPKSKLKAGDARKAYSIGRPQPLLKFALSSGCHSDPMVRIYTPKRVFQELEIAKEEYIQRSCRIQKEQLKTVLPKIVDCYAKEMGLCTTSLLQMIEHCTQIRTCQQPHQHIKLYKKIEWIPHNFTFRYLLAPELAK